MTENTSAKRIFTAPGGERYHRHRPVAILGTGPDGSQVCIEYKDPEDGGHAHVPAGEITEQRYPDVEVHLSTGHDSHTGAIMGSVSRALKHAGYSPAVVNEYRAAVFDCQSHDEVLQLAMRWVTVT